MSYSHPLDYSVPFTISPETMVYNYPKNEVGNDPTHAWIMAEVIDNSLEAYQRTDSSGPGEVSRPYPLLISSITGRRNCILKSWSMMVLLPARWSSTIYLVRTMS